MTALAFSLLNLVFQNRVCVVLVLLVMLCDCEQEAMHLCKTKVAFLLYRCILSVKYLFSMHVLIPSFV